MASRYSPTQPTSARTVASGEFIPPPQPISPFEATFANSRPVADWSADDLHEWLRSLKCGDHIQSFERNDISGDILVELTKPELKQLIPVVGDRVRVHQAIKYLRQVNAPGERAERPKDAGSGQSTLSSNPPSATLGSMASTSNSSDYFAGVDAFTSDRYDGDSLRFAYTDGKTRFVNVSRCRSANDVKLTVLRKVFPSMAESALPNWTVYDGARVVADSELVLLARNPNANMLLSIRNTPPRNVNVPARTDPRNPARQSVQRPTSQQVSNNLDEYFPEADKDELKATLRKSVIVQRRISSIRGSQRFSRRLSNLIVPGLTASDSQATLTAGVAPAGTVSPVPRARPTTSTPSSRRTSYARRFSSLATLSKHDMIEESAEAGDLAPPSEAEEPELAAVLESEGMVPTEWFKGQVIGSGSFGTVYMGVNKSNGELLAVKQVELPTDAGVDEQRKKKMVSALQREITIMRDFDHENIVQYVGFMSEGNTLNIFLEYVPGGSLASMLSQMGSFEETLVQHHSKQILAGLAYLHDRSIIHRDIKGANILVDNKGTIKISDFGLSKKSETQQLVSNNRQSMQGSAFWMAPEVVKQRGTTVKADIWSFGCLVIEMLTGTHPFPTLTQMQAIYRIGNQTKPEIPEQLSPTGKDFVERTLAINLELRPSANELLQHPYLTA